MRVPIGMDFNALDSSLSGMGSLSGREFYVFDEETEERSENSALIKSPCPPFMLAPGFVVEPLGVKRGQYRDPSFGPREKVPKRPGFLSGCGQNPCHCGCSLSQGWVPGMPTTRELYYANQDIFGLGQLGAFWEVVAPTGGAIAAFRCRPFYVAEDLALKQVQAGQETLVQRGAAEEPEGTVRDRTSPFYTVRR